MSDTALETLLRHEIGEIMDGYAGESDWGSVAHASRPSATTRNGAPSQDASPGASPARRRLSSRARRAVLLAAPVVAIGAVAFFALSAGPAAHQADAGPSIRSSMSALQSASPGPVGAARMQVVRAFASGTETDGATGSPVLGSASILLDDLGARDAFIFAYPTSTGAVCYGLADQSGSGGTCAMRYSEHQSFTWAVESDFIAPGGLTWSYGLAADSVSIMSVTLADGTVIRTQVRNNAWYVETPAENRPTRIEAHLDDGTVQAETHLPDNANEPGT
jgi:hypothetical protein